VTSEIIVALITCGGTLCGVWLQNRKHNRDITELIEYRVSKLEEKQDKHNNLIERVYEIEGAINLLDDRVKAANRRIKDLEEDTKDGR
jgi:predicted nuclease with TOPRIM domain